MQTLIFILSINTPFKLNLIYNQQPTKMEFTAKKKGGHDFGRLAIFNSVTLSTRVRLKVLWAMAKKFSGRKELTSIGSCVSRPTLLVKDGSGKRRPLNILLSKTDKLT